MIHVITGAPCSGKSSYVAEHATDGDVRIDYDHIAKAIGSSTEHDASGHIKKAAFVMRQSGIDYLLENTDAEGWIIHTNPTDAQMDAYEKAGAEIIELDADRQTCLERAESEGRPQRVIDAINAYFGEKGATMDKRVKTVELSAETNENGIIKGYAATWTREPDSYGDVIAKGAFAECIEALKAAGKKIPFMWNHNANDLNAYIGIIDELKEDDHGLAFEGGFDDTPNGQRARQLTLDGRLQKFSFAYDVLDEAEVELEDGRKANELRKLNIHEVSLVMYPANPDTSIVEVKGDDEEVDTKSGRRNSAKDAEELRNLTELLGQAQAIVNNLLDEESDEAEPVEDDTEVKPEDSDTDNGEEQKYDVNELIKSADKLLND